MAMKPPGHLKHKTGQAFVRISGKNIYLGAYGTPLSKERYKQALAEHWDPTARAPSERHGQPSRN